VIGISVPLMDTSDDATAESSAASTTPNATNRGILGRLSSPVVMPLDLRVDGREFDSRPPPLVLRTGKSLWYFTKSPRLTRPPTLRGTGNEYRPNCGDALRLGSKGRMAHSTCG